jgi:DNA-binding transcriptional ArsR family regulator
VPDTVASPEILWDSGTAYDLFASLYVIHTPGDYGLRPSWAAGIRSRLSTPARELLAATIPPLTIPMTWLLALEGPKTARAALERLETMSPAELLPALALNPGKPDACDELLRGITSRGEWTPADRDALLGCADCHHIKELRNDPAALGKWLDAWASPAAFGQGFRAALREFYEVFYRDEERRIAGDIERGLAHARELAGRLPFAELFEELSQGIRAEVHFTKKSLVLVPCYWCSPRIVYTDLTEDREMVLFGCRPPEASLIPGDTIPARLLLALEALSDPTRLSILRAIIAEPLTQADIARRLRLRPPTISHHITRLRIAGLVAYTGTGSSETRYGARVQQLDQTLASLKEFLEIRNAPGAPANAPGAPVNTPGAPVRKST